MHRELSLATSSISDWSDPAPARMTRIRFPIGKAAIVLAFSCALALVWEFRRPWFQGNVGIVDSGRVIRAAQPTSQLSQLVDQYGLKSILNLRGGSPSDPFYESEVKTVRDRGLAFYDLPLSATRRPSRYDLLHLIDIFDRCPYPLLIHCKSGADRTGLASALYLMLNLGESPLQAERAFSLAFGHIALGGPEHLHEPLHEYALWLESNGLVHTAERFRAWVKLEYRSADPTDDPPLVPTGPRPRRP
jgi:protein tyrosine phosphatase (PTP) superfamily phosphohydrolase (DUF442 family)